jgi:hydroxyquinol 1,2-dioxygenase
MMTSAHTELLAEVLSRYEHSPNPRLREITEAAVRHLHAFAADVNLQRDEWLAGIQFLTATGKICDGVRQEFILLSDTLGVSTLVELLTHAGAQGTTNNTVLGPFYVPGSPERAAGESMLVDPDDGDRVVVRGRVTDVAGEAIAGAKLDAWQNATNGFYACQQPGVRSEHNLRGVYRTDADGSYEIRTIRPVPYPIPDDGPAGELLKANCRSWWRPGHLHLWVSAPGCKDLITHVFDEESEHLDSDAVFGVRPGLVRSFRPDAAGELATTFDIVLDAINPPAAPSTTAAR